MTNILASIVVTLVTNTTEHWPQVLVPDEPKPRASTFGVYFSDTLFRGKWVNQPDATHKTNVTTCIERTALRFEWNGPQEVVSERVLWQSNQVMQLEWVTKP